MIGLGFMGFFGRKVTEVKCQFLLHHIEGYILSPCLSLDHLTEGVFVRFVHCKGTFLPVSILSSLERRHQAQPTLEWGVDYSMQAALEKNKPGNRKPSNREKEGWIHGGERRDD